MKKPSNLTTDELIKYIVYCSYVVSVIAVIIASIAIVKVKTTFEEPKIAQATLEPVETTIIPVEPTISPETLCTPEPVVEDAVEKSVEANIEKPTESVSEPPMAVLEGVSKETVNKATTVTETPAPATEETAVNDHDVELLACVIYQEAGGNNYCDDCRRRVADVVLNRVADSRFPNTIEEVLTAPRQYGRFHWTGVVWPDRASADTEKEAVERAYNIAREVLEGQHSDLYGQGYIWQAEFKQGTGIIYHCGNYFGK